MAKIPGKGTVLQLILSSTTYTTVANGVEIVPFEVTNTPINTTILTSSAQRFEATAIPDYGNCNWTGWWDVSDTTHGTILSAMSNGNSSNSWRINFADTDTAVATFLGAVVGFAPTGVVQDQMVQIAATIKIDGAATVTT